MNWSNKWPSPNEDQGSGPLPMDGSVAWGSKKIKGEWGIDLAKGDDLTTARLTLTWDNNRQVNVIVIGDLGLEWPSGPEEGWEGWCIYHIPSATKFMKAIPPRVNIEVNDDAYSYNKQPLLNWMKRVQENYPTSWQMLRLLTPNDYEGKAVRPKEIIQQWCLSVKVE